MNQIMRQPLPRAPVPPIEETLRHLNRNSNGQSSPSILTPAPLPHSVSFGGAKLAMTGQSLVESKEAHEGNPYIRRAYEIGPSHRIPGLAHLGGLLIPPGWKDGDEPINPQAAQALYDKARREARDALTKSMEDSIYFSAGAQEQRTQDRDKEWDTQLRLDRMVLEERIKIYENFKARKRMYVQGAGLGQLGTPKSVALAPPLTLHPPTSTSAPAYAGPVHTDTFFRPLRFANAYGNQVGQQGKFEALGAVIQ